MCLLAIAFQQHSNAPLVVMSNRDEFYARPSRSLHWWDDAPILAGRDIQAGGTWMGLSRNGHFAAVTNYRHVHNGRSSEARPLSRGHLVSGFLNSGQSAAAWVDALRPRMDDYGGFNLLISDGTDLVYLNNYSQEKPEKLLPGVYALSNNLLNSPWPKVDYARQKLQQAIDNNTQLGNEQVQQLMGDLSLQKAYSEDLLPNTGVTPEWEKILSSPFIIADGYGTRASSVVIVSASGKVDVVERRFDDVGLLGEIGIDFKISKP